MGRCGPRSTDHDPLTKMHQTRACDICGNAEGNVPFVATEMMFGLRDRFTYLRCAACGCLQLLDPPSDWSRYYPPTYYAFDPPPSGRTPWLRRSLRRTAVRHALGERSVLGKALGRRWVLPHFLEWARHAGVGPDAAILDVGSGAGHLLVDMENWGFTNLTGVDPYIPADVEPTRSVRLLKREIGDVSGSFDLVMMHHAFEHMADPEAVLREVARLLPPGRSLLIRVPVAGKYAWREYGADWVQLDAPRHLFLHTEQSIERLAERTGFAVREVHFDSEAFQFWGSEQYRRGIPLNDVRSYSIDASRSPFTPAEIEEYQQTANGLNERHDGDQACFYLRRL